VWLLAFSAGFEAMRFQNSGFAEFPSEFPLDDQVGSVRPVGGGEQKRFHVAIRVNDFPKMHWFG
jgi:hypothetical protein